MEVRLISSAAHGRCHSLPPSILSRQVITQPRHASWEHSHDWISYPGRWCRSPASIPLHHRVPLLATFCVTNAHVNSCSASRDNCCTGTLLNRIMTRQWEGMGDVGSARYELALLPLCPTIRVLSYSNWQRSNHTISKWIFRNLAL